MPYEITQCYLPPGRGDFPAFTPAKAGTRFSDPESGRAGDKFASGTYKKSIMEPFRCRVDLLHLHTAFHYHVGPIHPREVPPRFGGRGSVPAQGEAQTQQIAVITQGGHTLHFTSKSERQLTSDVYESPIQMQICHF